MPRSNHSRRFVQDRAKELAARVEARHPGSVEQLGKDPLDCLADWPDIHLVVAPEREISSGCSVSGSYDYKLGRIVVGSALSRGRRYFTALHEFGHHFQQHDEESVKLFEVEDDIGRALEDDICDAFAAQVLLPDDLVAEYIDAKGPTAHAVFDLMRGSDASREACCVRAVQRLPGKGYVMLCDSEGLAIFTASTTGYPVRRNTHQAGNAVVAAAVRWRSGRELSRVRFSTGNLSPRYFADAAAEDDYLVAVFVEHMPPWERGPHYPIPQPNHGIRAGFGEDRTLR